MDAQELLLYSRHAIHAARKNTSWFTRLTRNLAIREEAYDDSLVRGTAVLIQAIPVDERLFTFRAYRSPTKGLEIDIWAPHYETAEMMLEGAKGLSHILGVPAKIRSKKARFVTDSRSEVDSLEALGDTLNLDFLLLQEVRRNPSSARLEKGMSMVYDPSKWINEYTAHRYK